MAKYHFSNNCDEFMWWVHDLVLQVTSGYIGNQQQESPYNSVGGNNNDFVHNVEQRTVSTNWSR